MANPLSDREATGAEVVTSLVWQCRHCKVLGFGTGPPAATFSRAVAQNDVEARLCFSCARLVLKAIDEHAEQEAVLEALRQVGEGQDRRDYISLTEAETKMLRNAQDGECIRTGNEALIFGTPSDEP